MSTINRQIKKYLIYCEYTRKMSPFTLIAKRSVYNRFIAITKCRNLKHLTNSCFDRWSKYELEHGVSASTLNTYNANLLALINYYRELGLRIPFRASLVGKLKETPANRQFYTVEQLNEVMQAADDTAALMIRIAFETGMRIAELTSLRLCNFSNNQVRFISKGNKLRVAYISNITINLLSKYIKSHHIKEWLWLDPSTKEHLGTHAVRKILKAPFLKSGYSDFYPHSLRHSFATNLQLNGATLDEIRFMIGHSSVATTERYIHGLEGQLESLFKKYAEFNQKL